MDRRKSHQLMARLRHGPGLYRKALSATMLRQDARRALQSLVDNRVIGLTAVRMNSSGLDGYSCLAE